MIQTIKSNPNVPSRIIIYGPEGVGKSSFGAFSNKPVFITPEGGANQLKTKAGGLIDIMPNCKTFDQVRGAVNRLINEEHHFKTLVLDSADWIEKLCHKKIIGPSDRSIITCNGGYGAGYRESENLHRALIEDLTVLVEKTGLAIIITAHSQIKETKDPSVIENYDSFEIKCQQFVSDLWREWVDALLFVRFRAYAKEGKAKAVGDDTRVMYTVKDPAYQAKNRYGMPKELEFDWTAWETVNSYTKGKTADQVMKDCVKLISGIASDEKKKQILSFIQNNSSNVNALTSGKNRIEEILESQKTEGN